MRRKVCKTSEVPPDGMVAFDIDGRRIMVANVQGTFYAIDDTCSHAEASLSEGYLDVDECTVECPLHSAVFSLESGEALEFPAEDPVASHPVTVEGDDLYVEVDGD
jgi:3-phenylpropionate/trans-cinnamate dioxygenase ferredoxin subunit